MLIALHYQVIPSVCGIPGCQQMRRRMSKKQRSASALDQTRSKPGASQPGRMADSPAGESIQKFRLADHVLNTCIGERILLDLPPQDAAQFMLLNQAKRRLAKPYEAAIYFALSRPPMPTPPLKLRAWHTIWRQCAREVGFSSKC